jgi:hypothetical protein
MVLHLLDAKNIGWQCMKLNECVIVPSSYFDGTLADLENLILQEAQGWEQWIAAVQEIHFEHEFFYYGLEHQQLEISIADRMFHVFEAFFSSNRFQLQNLGLIIPPIIWGKLLK